MPILENKELNHTTDVDWRGCVVGAVPAPGIAAGALQKETTYEATNKNCLQIAFLSCFA